MEQDNEQAQVDVVEQEEQTSEEEVADTEAEAEETVTIPKAKFTDMRRKAIAYESNKTKPKTLQTKSEPVDENIVQTVKSLELAEKKRQFGYEHGLSPEETDKVFQISGGKPSKKTLEDPFIKAGIEAIRASKRVEANTPGSSTSSKLYGGKDFSELSSEERQKAWSERTKNFKP